MPVKTPTARDIRYIARDLTDSKRRLTELMGEIDAAISVAEGGTFPGELLGNAAYGFFMFANGIDRMIIDSTGVSELNPEPEPEPTGESGREEEFMMCGE
jgi:hypothetical protein